MFPGPAHDIHATLTRGASLWVASATHTQRAPLEGHTRGADALPPASRAVCSQTTLRRFVPRVALALPRLCLPQRGSASHNFKVMRHFKAVVFPQLRLM